MWQDFLLKDVAVVFLIEKLITTTTVPRIAVLCCSILMAVADLLCKTPETTTIGSIAVLSCDSCDCGHFCCVGLQKDYN